MKLKGIRTIALLVAAVILVIGSVAGLAAAGAGDSGGNEQFRCGEGWRMDARYWWEDEQWKEDTGDLSPYERQQVRDILVLILDTYFGIDISRMSLDELDEVGRLIGFDLLGEKLPPLFEQYAQKKGIEMPESPEPTAPLPVEPDPYWWYIVGYPEATIQWIMEQVAEAKGMSPDEVRTSFGKLFPGVELWNMSFGEFAEFIDSLPRPPLEPVSFEELKDKPNIIVFGRVPEFSGEQELREFNQKLEKLLNQVLDQVVPLLRDLKRCEFPLLMIGAYRGAISIDVPSHCLRTAQEIYLLIAEKAESVFGIDDVPVIFRAELRRIRFLRAEASKRSNTTPCDWEAPWDEPFCPIPGAVKVTADCWGGATTTSFAVRRFTWWPWDWWDEDYIITGHKGPPDPAERPTITPVNMSINQPTPEHEAGTVKDNVGTSTYAGAARVGICDARVRPYVHIGGSPSQPVLRPIFDADDPEVGDITWISAARTGLTLQVEVVRHVSIIHLEPPPYEALKNQFFARPIGNIWPMDGDSGSPHWLSVWCPERGHGTKIHGLSSAVVEKLLDGEWVPEYIILSPVSGLSHEFPGWAVWRR